MTREIGIRVLAATEVRRSLTADGDLRGEVDFQNDVNALLARVEQWQMPWRSLSDLSPAPLVVESTNYNNKGSIATSAATGRIRGIPQSDALKVTERFTRVDANTINYTVTIEDPKVYSKPWTVALPLNRDDTYQMFEYSCQEGNYAMANALSYGRKRDAEASSGSSK